MSELVKTNEANQLSFKREKGEMILNMTLERDEDQKFIRFLLTHKSKSDKYALVVKEDYIEQQDQHFTIVAKTIQDLFEFIVESFQELIITEDGIIRFCITLTSFKKKHSKQYELHTIKIDQKNSEASQIAEQLKLFRQEILQNLAKKDERITLLQNQIRISKQVEKMREQEKDNLENELNIFRADIQSRIGKLAMQEDAIVTKIMNRFVEQNERQMEEMGKSIEQAANKIKKIGFEVQTVLLTIATHKSMFGDLQQTLSQIQKNQIQKKDKAELLTPFLQNIDNPHRGYFKVKELQNSVLISQIQASDNFLNYISAKPILKNCKQSFIIKKIETKINSIYIGIGTKGAFGEVNSMNCKQTIAYWCYNGQIYKNGGGRQGGRKIEDGQTILMTVDVEEWTIDWYFQGSQRQITSIPQHLRNQQLYIFIMMDKKGDTVQIMT